ncbi:MAG: hypothetical protein K0S65_376 [Labilithrix sp.]|nr:hypothetical protein [Labilithrix sp.]
MTDHFEDLARRVERHWGEESRNALARDEERLRALVDGAMAAASRASPSASPLLSKWTKGAGLCVAAAVLGSAVHGGHVRATATATAPSPVAPQQQESPPPAAPVATTAIAVADLPAADVPVVKPASVMLPSAARVAPPTPPLSSADLFARANEERRRGDLGAAEADYRLLMKETPSSREALLSHVILGRMIEGRDPAAALGLFERYLQLGDGGVLAEEARTSRARLLSKVGKQREAASAWRELLERHPDTVHRSEAEAGLHAADE